MAIHGPFYWKEKAEELKEINNNLVEELSTTERKMYDLQRENFRKDDKLSNMRTIGWRITAILHCLSGLEYVYAVDVLKDVQERLERDRDKSHVKCE